MGFVVFALGLFLASVIFFIIGLIKLCMNMKKEEKKISTSKIFPYFITAALCAMVSFGLVFDAYIEHRDYYKVLEIYNEGVGARCLNDGEYKTTVIPLSEEATKPLKEFDVIDEYGNVIIDGAWLGAKPTATDETAVTDAD